MILSEECIDDLAEVIGDNPVTVRYGALTFEAFPGPVIEGRDFYVGSTEYRADMVVTALQSIAGKVEAKEQVTVEYRNGSIASLRVLEKHVDQFGAGVVLTLGSPTRHGQR